MGSKSILCLWIVLTIGVFGVITAEIEEPPVALPSNVQEYEQIKWIFKPQNRNGEEEWYIASCRVNETPLCKITLQTDEQINTFKDRLKIHNNGSLTIKNLSIKQAGLYTLQIIDKSKKSYEREINVSAPAPKTVNDSDQTKQPSQPYSDSGLSPGYVALICVVVLGGAGAAVAAAVFFYKRRKPRRDVRRNVPVTEPGPSCIVQITEPLTVDTVPETEPGTSCIVQVTEPLTVDTECAYRYEKENGTVSSINSYPDERRSFKINEEL